jgi:hypothetical protein
MNRLPAAGHVAVVIDNHVASDRKPVVTPLERLDLCECGTRFPNLAASGADWRFLALFGGRPSPISNCFNELWPASRIRRYTFCFDQRREVTNYVSARPDNRQNRCGSAAVTRESRVPCHEGCTTLAFLATKMARRQRRLQGRCACNLRCLRTEQPALFHGPVRTAGIDDDDDLIKDPHTTPSLLEVPPPRSIFEKRVPPRLLPIGLPQLFPSSHSTSALHCLGLPENKVSLAKSQVFSWLSAGAMDLLC